MQGNETIQMVVVAVFLFAIVASLVIAWTRPLPELAGRKYKKPPIALVEHQAINHPNCLCSTELRKKTEVNHFDRFFEPASARLADTIKATVDIHEAQINEDFEYDNDVYRAAQPSIAVLLERIRLHGVEPEVAEAIGALFVLVDGVTKQAMLDAESFDQRLKVLEDQRLAQLTAPPIKVTIPR